MWPLNETPRSISLLGDHIIRSETRVYEVERNTWVDALREELNTLTLQNAPTLPPARVAPDTALPRTTNPSRIELAPKVSTANRGGIYAAVFGSGPQTRMTGHSVSDDRRFGIYLPSATASENNLALHRLAASTLHVSEGRAASLPPTSPMTVAALDQRTRRPRRSTRRYKHPPNHDPPPEYVAFDPYPFFDANPKPRRRSTIEIIETCCRDGFKATTGKVGKSVVKHIEDASKIAKDVPTAFKEAQVKFNLKRAKDKIRWLEKHHYLSGQERLLTQELVG
ncbi:hypothetical protein AA0113_g2707 [Alternaria arborescens]|uniref:Uncharacterized protein n=1 Tax=Alternaria arborescens TaxID=156630 RepID=A0A4Q4SKB3_9PLEO|nr:hypothetical protein AA0112_g696 [Alternaria arborescens]RYO71150.1 hypothetical protein AA0113_g2707 [Alternaria arborescens]